MKQHLVTILIAAAIVSGCRRIAAAPSETLAPVPVGSFMRAWRADIGLERDTVREVFLRDPFIIIYTKSSTAYVLSRSGGEMRFIHEIQTTGGILRPPIVLPDKIVYPTATTLEIYATNGKHLRTLPLPNSTHGPGGGAGNRIFVSLDYPEGGRIGAVDLTRTFNTVVWELYTRAGVSAAPAVHDPGVFIGTEDGSVFAVAPDRTPLWTGLPKSVFKTYGGIVADLKADDFGVYVASKDTKLYCLDRQTGQVKWQYFADIGLDTPPAITATSVYQYLFGRGLAAIDKTTGSYNRVPRWILRDGRQFLAEDEKNSYVRLRDNSILAVDKFSGEQRFRSKSHFDLFVSNEKDSTIYAATFTGRVYAIRPVLIPGQVGTLVMNDCKSCPILSLSSAR